MIEAFFASLTVVALAEIGDKTMLLAILLAARFRAPVPILAGIFCATVANHTLAAFAGDEVAGLLDSLAFRVAVGLGFIAMAAWTLVPDKLEDDDQSLTKRGGAFLTTLVSFFLVEIGDKTQIATIALGAHYHSTLVVASGTTVGMMLADGPAVFMGDALVKRISLRKARIAAALIFLVLGAAQLLRTFGVF